jgi:predicted GH43/DUF377 family glycosyl hydrolase
MQRPVGVYTNKDKVYMLFGGQDTSSELLPTYSTDGFSFEQDKNAISVAAAKLNISALTQFTEGDKTFFLIKDNNDSYRIASQNFELRKNVITNFQPVNIESGNMAIVSQYQHNDNYVMYYGDRAVTIAFSKDMQTWQTQGSLLQESFPVKVGAVFNMEDGILLLYFGTTIENGVTYHCAYLALFSAEDPKKLLWKSAEPIWNQKEQWPDMAANYIGTATLGDHLISYWHVNNEVIFGVLIADAFVDSLAHHKAQVNTKLVKHEANPIIAPNLENNWEAFNTFNPAAFYTKGKVHILYRAQGFDYISSIGYATSEDGINIDERSQEPIFAHFINHKGEVDINFDFVSGGGFGGCEDPRVTRIGDRIYMIYVAFDGATPPRLALTHIHVDDFLSKRWLWSKPVLISLPGIVDKSGCLLPEKINGKFVVFHRIFPNILIDFVDDLNFDGRTKFLKGEHSINIRPDMWDSRKIGAGAPPVKTKDGWLLIYYGVDDKNASKYHIGAMLLDLKDPTKVLYRSNQPILEANEIYEMNGFKPGIAYPCGAVIIKDKLLVYYGGADSVVCVATASLDTFLDNLKLNKPTYLRNVNVRKVTV